ncbi:MAG: Hpt domain-containing protein [Bacteroidales bacterium]|nr:Hpt domain-containing protein [Bacteroidales bacterium]
MITDLTYLNNMTDGNPELIQEMINIFTSQVDEYIVEMNSLYDLQNWNGLSRLAHKAKSSVAIMGMTNLAEMLKEFEINAKDHLHIEKYPEYIYRFTKDCITACEELNNLTL